MVNAGSVVFIEDLELRSVKSGKAVLRGKPHIAILSLRNGLDPGRQTVIYGEYPGNKLYVFGRILCLCWRRIQQTEKQHGQTGATSYLQIRHRPPPGQEREN